MILPSEVLQWMAEDDGGPEAMACVLLDMTEIEDLLEVIPAGLATPRLKFQPKRVERIQKNVSLFRAIVALWRTNNGRPR